MTKSTTDKKAKFKQAQDEFTNFGIQYLKNWTKQELKKYYTEPVVIPYGNHGFFIGPYDVSGIHAECWKVVSKLDPRFVYYFTNKSAALIYCLLNVKQKYAQAREILEIDTKLGRIDMDIKHYEHSLSAAQKKNDKVKFSIVLNRYIDAKIQRRTYKIILKKNLNSAKYINLRKELL